MGTKMARIFAIFIIIFVIFSIDANALSPYRKKAPKEPSVEVNLFVLSGLKEDIYGASSAPVTSRPVIAPPEERRNPRSQSEEAVKKAAPEKAPPAPKKAQAAEPEKIVKVPEPKIEAPKLTPIAPQPEPAPIIDIPPLPNFITEEPKEPELSKLPEPKLKAPELPKKIEPVKIEPPKLSPPIVTAPKFVAPKAEIPDLEVPKFVAPEIPQPPKLPKISSDEETITVPELPTIEKQINADAQGTVYLPPPVFDEPKTVNIASEKNTKNLPSVSDLFGDTPRPPVERTATQEPKSLIGKPSLESVKIQQQSLPSLSQLPLSSEAPAMSVAFAEAEVDFPLTEQASLLEIVSEMQSNPNSIIKVVAYASGTPDQASQAKRTALARALSVRKFLKERDIDSERIIIRPMGNKATSGVPDRVDIFLTAKQGA